MTSEDSESFISLLVDDDEVWVPAGYGGPGYNIEVRVLFSTRAKDRVSKRVRRKGYQNHGTICTEVKMLEDVNIIESINFDTTIFLNISK